MRKYLVVLALLLSSNAFAMRPHLFFQGGMGFGHPGMAGAAPGSGAQMMGYQPGQVRAPRPGRKVMDQKAITDLKEKWKSLPKVVQENIQKCLPSSRARLIMNYTPPPQYEWTEADEKEYREQLALDDFYEKQEEEEERNREANEKKEKERVAEVYRQGETQAKTIETQLTQIEKDLATPVVMNSLDKQAHAYLKSEVQTIRTQTEQGNKVLHEREWAGRFLLNYAANKAQAIGEFTDGLATGIYKGFYNTTQVMKHIYDHPALVAQITNAVVEKLSHPYSFWTDIRDAFYQYSIVMAYGTPHEKGEALGEFASNLVLGMTTGPIINVGLRSAFAGVSTDLIKTSLGTTVAKKVMPVLEVPLRSDIDKVKASVLKEPLTDAKTMKGRKIANYIQANTRNAEAKALERQPSYLPDSQIIVFFTKSTEKFVRLHGANNMLRSWVVEKEAIAGLTPEQLQLKYFLPERPYFISDVEVPAGTWIERSRICAAEFRKKPGSYPIAEHLKEGLEGSIQYEIKSRIDPTWFKNSRKLE